MSEGGEPQLKNICLYQKSEQALKSTNVYFYSHSLQMLRILLAI
jgi:hypothetical protein